ERAHDLRDRRLLLTDRVVDADDTGVFLIEDRIDGNRGFAGLPVADDQLALSAADRHHRIDGLEAGLQRLLHGLSIDDARRQALDRRELLRRDRALAVDRLPERIDDAAEQLVADRHRDDPPGPLDRVAFPDFAELAQEHRADAVLFEVQRDPVHAVGELEHLAGHRVVDAVHPGDAVADGDDAADLGDIDVDREAPYLV